MSRLELCKNRLEEKQKAKPSQKDLELLYQELINYLPTYKEKKEFSLYYAQSKKELVLV